MPSSHNTYISDVVTYVRQLNPRSILDVGLGFGKWGLLFREYLDVMHGRLEKKEWTLRLDGVEIFKPYIFDHQKYIYNTIYNVDISAVPISGKYDLIFMSDVLEHIEKEAGKVTLTKLKEHASVVYIMLPIGKEWYHSQGAKHGNMHEAHISWWSPEEMFEMGFNMVRKYSCGYKEIASFRAR